MHICVFARYVIKMLYDTMGVASTNYAMVEALLIVSARLYSKMLNFQCVSSGCINHTPDSPTPDIWKIHFITLGPLQTTLGTLRDALAIPNPSPPLHKLSQSGNLSIQI